MLLSIIFTTLIMPVQVHPLNLMQWPPPQAPMVAQPPSQLRASLVYLEYAHRAKWSMSMSYTLAPYIESIPVKLSFGNL